MFFSGKTRKNKGLKPFCFFVGKTFKNPFSHKKKDFRPIYFNINSFCTKDKEKKKKSVLAK
jgi:hypothetical protein